MGGALCCCCAQPCFSGCIFPAPQPTYTCTELKCPRVTSTMGDKIPLFVRTPYPGALTLLYSHGNGEDLGHCIPEMERLSEVLHCNYALYDYPGYGDATVRKPTEARCYAAIEVALRALISPPLSIPLDRIIIYGRSIGTGPSVNLAFRLSNPRSARRIIPKELLGPSTLPGGVILQSPLRSAIRVVFPSCSPCGDLFRNDRKISRISCPVFIVHGRADEVVPFTHGLHLYSLLKASSAYPPLWIDGAGHNNIELGWWRQKDAHFRAFMVHLAQMHPGVPMPPGEDPEPQVSARGVRSEPLGSRLTGAPGPVAELASTPSSPSSPADATPTIVVTHPDESPAMSGPSPRDPESPAPGWIALSLLVLMTHNPKEAVKFLTSLIERPSNLDEACTAPFSFVGDVLQAVVEDATGNDPFELYKNRLQAAIEMVMARRGKKEDDETAGEEATSAPVPTDPEERTEYLNTILVHIFNVATSPSSRAVSTPNPKKQQRGSSNNELASPAALAVLAALAAVSLPHAREVASLCRQLGVGLSRITNSALKGGPLVIRHGYLALCCAMLSHGDALFTRSLLTMRPVAMALWKPMATRDTADGGMEKSTWGCGRAVDLGAGSVPAVTVAHEEQCQYAPRQVPADPPQGLAERLVFSARDELEEVPNRLSRDAPGGPEEKGSVVEPRRLAVAPILGELPVPRFCQVLVPHGSGDGQLDDSGVSGPRRGTPAGRVGGGAGGPGFAPGAPPGSGLPCALAAESWTTTFRPAAVRAPAKARSTWSWRFT
ncbi:putative protein ABHD17B [Paratrimastix pyriformis]|uniref:Uncharacterized protein n=1 Tax=Paratrimastix pyriformis TaxID=342808 RepID=A0ABQ8U5I0_9EUKA|nr:putative protein ABHD17B [Paratrimastix pyriformis]